MKFKVDFNYVVNYYPNKRCRKVRKMLKEDNAFINIKEVTSHDAPVAFWVTTFSSWYPETEYAPLTETYPMEYWRHGQTGVKLIPVYDRYITYPIRYLNGHFYKEYVSDNIHYLNPEAHSYEWREYSFLTKQDTNKLASLSYSQRDITRENYSLFVEINECDRPYELDTSIIQGDNRNERIKVIQSSYDDCLFIDGRLYVECPEPRYVVNTFGLGHNHGGTAYFVEFDYNNNIGSKNYFRADQYDEMLTYAVKVASSRGDTKDVESMPKDKTYIQVLRPDLVNLRPDEEAGDGDPFMNELEETISSASSSTEAGLLVMAQAIASTK